MKTADLSTEGMCPECGCDECLGLTNGHGLCMACDSEFLIPVATDEAAIECFARIAIQWRAWAMNTAQTHGHAASGFEHGVANFYTAMLPPNRQAECAQGNLFSPADVKP